MAKLGSRKLWVTLATLVVTLVQQHEGAPWYVLVTLGLVAAGYTVGQGLADGGNSKADEVLRAVQEALDAARKP